MRPFSSRTCQTPSPTSVRSSLTRPFPPCLKLQLPHRLSFLHSTRPLLTPCALPLVILLLGYFPFLNTGSKRSQRFLQIKCRTRCSQHCLSGGARKLQETRGLSTRASHRVVKEFLIPWAFGEPVYLGLSSRVLQPVEW